MLAALPRESRTVRVFFALAALRGATNVGVFFALAARRWVGCAEPARAADGSGNSVGNRTDSSAATDGNSDSENNVTGGQSSSGDVRGRDGSDANSVGGRNGGSSGGSSGGRTSGGGSDCRLRRRCAGLRAPGRFACGRRHRRAGLHRVGRSLRAVAAWCRRLVRAGGGIGGIDRCSGGGGRIGRVARWDWRTPHLFVL